MSYLKRADSIAADIASGRLRPGDRLPPQREYAYREGIAASTAGRVFAELLRRGLIVGEVGRGTFVAAPKPAASALMEPRHIAVDLELNTPLLPDQASMLTESLTRLFQPEALASVLPATTARGTASDRQTAATFLARAGWTPHADRILFTGNGRQGIAAAIAALVPVGGRLGVEEVTYPAVKAIAARLGVTLIPLPMDGHGVRPDRLVEIHAATPLSALYLQPALHNPLGLTMSPARRRQLTEFVRAQNLIVIEDAIYAFLADEAPLAVLLPEHGVVVDSLSKRIAPGLSVGFVVAPLPLVDRIAAAIRSGAWFASSIAREAAFRMMTDGTANAIVRAKRKDAARRQAIALEELSAHKIRTDPRAYHLWLELPKPWRAEQFAATAARKGIALAQASAFAVRPGHATKAIRIALASPPLPELRRALQVLARLLDSDPDEEPRLE